MLKIALCEYVETDLAELEKTLNEITSIRIDLDVFTNGKDLLNTIEREGNYDVYLLSMQLTNITAKQIAKKIRLCDMYSIIIFLSYNIENILEVFEYITFDYLIKPISKEKLVEILIKAECFLGKNYHVFRYQFKKTTYNIICSEIYYIHKSRRKAYIYTSSGHKECNMRVYDILNNLNPYFFVQINRADIINLRYVERVQKNFIYIIGQKISIGDTHYNDFIEKYHQYIESLK